jgi:IclR family transcriptional regulator, KDG regulon repressor
MAPPGSASAGDSQTSVMRSLKRGLTVLAQFTAERPEWTLTEVSRETGIHVATTHRILKTLESEGFLSQNEETNRYYLGPAATRMAYLAESHDQLARMARPFLERLARATGETVGVVADANGSLLIVDEIRTAHPFKLVLPVGQTVEGFNLAPAKLFLAHRTPALRAKLVRGKLVPRTEKTIADEALYEKELQKVAAEGLAFDLEENFLGLCAVAAAARDESGEVRCAFQIVAPKERFGPADVDRYVGTLREAVSDFSAFLGYRAS